jgi:O-methyltransferase
LGGSGLSILFDLIARQAVAGRIRNRKLRAYIAKRAVAASGRDVRLAKALANLEEPRPFNLPQADHDRMVERAFAENAFELPSRLHKFVRGKAVLDVECGRSGAAATAFIATGARRYVGVDAGLDDAAADAARAYAGVELRRGRLGDMQSEGVFDTVILRDFNGARDDGEDELAFAAKLLGPSGRLILVPSPESTLSLDEHLKLGRGILSMKKLDGENRPVLFEGRPRSGSSASHRDILRDEHFLGFYRQCAGKTMTSIERLYAVYSAVGHVVRCGLPGDIVECGVWRGGSSMMAALALRHFGNDGKRRLWLYDTFAGMTRPTALDEKFDESGSAEKWTSHMRDSHNAWNFASLEEVQANLATTGFPADQLVFVQGDVTETLMVRRPDAISVLRLDTDFYESTKRELEVLWPRLMRGGVLIVDDYGTWRGSRQAVDEYFQKLDSAPMLHRSDAGGRTAIKID